MDPNTIQFNLLLAKLDGEEQHQPDDLIQSLDNVITHVSELSSSQLDHLIQSIILFVSCQKEDQSNDQLIPTLANLLLTVATHFTDSITRVCDTGVILLMLSGPAGAKLMLEQIESCTSLAICCFNGLLHRLGQATSLLVGCILKRFPVWRKPSLEIGSVVAGVTTVLSDQTIASEFPIADRCTLFTRLCQLLVDIELNPDGCMPSDDSYDWNPDQAILANEQPTLANIRQLLQSIPPKDSVPWTKLEISVWIIWTRFRCLIRTSDSNVSNANELDWPLLSALFKCIRDIFLQQVLPVHTDMVGVPHLLFFICSFRSGLVISLTESLWTVVKDEHRALDMGCRLKALAYLTYAMVYVKNCLLDLTVELLHDMSSWCVDYVYRHRALVMGTQSHSLVQDVELYYAVCASLFYTITMLHAPLLDSPYYRSHCERLPLTQILLSPLKPWSYMSDALRHVLYTIGSTYRLSCFTTGLVCVELDNRISKYSDESARQPTRITKQVLKKITPSQFFQLPFQQLSLRLVKPFLVATSRVVSVGKLIEQPVRKKRKESVLSSKKRRKRGGVDVSKLSRIVENTL